MGERKGQNKYYPPDFDPKKHRSLDAYHGTHALRERARKLDKGILIIRFEMPYNIWCDGCKNHIGMGVRYNSEKSKVGMYYTTPIYKFRMKCHLCNNHFEIKTDPANHDYVIISGARRKEQRWDPKENEQIVPEDKEDQKKMATDAMYKLEHGVDDKGKSKAAMPVISQLTDVRDQWKEDYVLNQALRQQFRERKKAQKVEAEKDQELLDKSSLDIKLVPENEQDVKMAELLRYSTTKSYDEKQIEKRKEIESRSIFESGSKTASFSSPMSSSTSSGTADSISGTTPNHKHLQARKALGQVITKNKLSPFASNVTGQKTAQGSTLSIQNLGIVRKSRDASTKKTCSNFTVSYAENTSNELDKKETSPLQEREVKDSKTMEVSVESLNSDSVEKIVGKSNALGSLASMYSDSDCLSDSGGDSD